MKVLLIGSGGREDALAWGLSRSPRLGLIRCAPGNAGIARRCECVPIRADDLDGLIAHTDRERYDLVVVGPEAPLVAGLADRLLEIGVPVFGPSAAAARIEGSKVFSKEFMSRHRIPTAAFEVFDDMARARAYLESATADYPLVVKADGLAAGKGVILAEDVERAVSAAESMLEGGRFGDAGRRILVEEMLEGREASFFVLADGERFLELATCQDYKRAMDGGRGPNTGGMGTYSPSVYLDDATRRTIVESIVQPTIRGLAEDASPYRGVLYVGVMLTANGPKVLEFNARFGDPETQVLVPRLQGDWLPLFHECATGLLADRPLRWKDEAAVCVVMSAGGYPDRYGKGDLITGIERAEAVQGAVVFHAGTSADDAGRPITAGGRVLGVTALGPDLAAARARAYEAVRCIHWQAEHHRTDIAEDALGHLDGRIST